MICGPRGIVVALAAACVAAAACAVPAKAATEFCPALLLGPYSKPSAGSPTVRYYHLRALGPRVVECTIVADTDAGWFTWNQQPVQLTRITYTSTTQHAESRFVVAETPELTVAFPQEAHVRRAWLATATTHGDAYFGWDAHGKVTCDPPDFAALTSRSSMVPTKRTPQQDDPTPGPAPPTAIAIPSAAPFAIPTCTKPFVAATVTDPVNPIFPEVEAREGFSGLAISEIYVAVNPQGKLADAWIFASSGYPTFDNAALTAARRSTYAAPTSYCRAVSGTYLFRADFEP